MVDIRKHFEPLYDLELRRKEIELKLEETRSRMYSVKGIEYDRIPNSSGSDRNSMIYDIDKTMELEETLYKFDKMIDDLRKGYIAEIKKAVSSFEKQRIIVMYYLDRKKIFEIAFMLGYSERHLIRLKKSGEEEYGMFLNE